MATPINYQPGTFARFFRAVKGRNVTRFGTARYLGGYRAATVIGGHRPPMKPDEQSKATTTPIGARGCNPIEHNLTMVTAITHQEARKFAREYGRAVNGGDLLDVTEEDYMDFLRADAEHAAKVTAKNESVKAAQADAIKREAGQAEKQAAARQTKGAKRKARRDKGTTPGDAGGASAGDGSAGPALE